MPSKIRGGVNDKHLADMHVPRVSALTTPGGAAASPLAAVPWVGQWKFNNNANDSVNSNNLTGTNSPTFTTGKIGGATGATQLTAASNQYWSVTDPAALRAGDVELLVAAWVYLDATGTACGVAGKWVPAAGREYLILYSGTRFGFYVSNDGTSFSNVDADTFGAPSANTWYLVVAWHDPTANTINICVNNGVPDSVSYSSGIFGGTSAFQVGCYDNGVAPMNGRIDDALVAKGSGAVPTQAVLDALYNSGNGTETLT